MLNKGVGEAEVKSIFDSMICSSITEDTVTSVSETYYPPATFTNQQVATGNQIITGYTNVPYPRELLIQLLVVPKVIPKLALVEGWV